MASVTVNRCLPIHHNENKNKSVCGNIKNYLASPFDYSGRGYRLIAIKNNQMEVVRDDRPLTSSEIAFKVFLTCLGFFIAAAVYKICRLIQLSKYTISLKDEPQIINDNISKAKMDPTVEVVNEDANDPAADSAEELPLPTKLADDFIKKSAFASIVSDSDSDPLTRLSNATVLGINKFKLPIDLEEFQELLKTGDKIESIVLPSLHLLDASFIKCLAVHASQNVNLICLTLKAFQQQFNKAMLNLEKKSIKHDRHRYDEHHYQLFLTCLISNNALKQEMSNNQRKDLQTLLFPAYKNRDIPDNIELKQALTSFMLQENDDPMHLLCISAVCGIYNSSEIFLQNVTDEQLKIISANQPSEHYLIVIFTRLLQDCMGENEAEVANANKIFEYIEKIQKAFPFYQFEKIFNFDGSLSDEFKSAFADKAELRVYFSLYQTLQIFKEKGHEVVKTGYIKQIIQYLSCKRTDDGRLFEQEMFGKILAENCSQTEITVCFPAFKERETLTIAFLSEILESNDLEKIKLTFTIFLAEHEKYSEYELGVFLGILRKIDSKEKLAAIRAAMPKDKKEEITKILIEGIHRPIYGVDQHYTIELPADDVKSVLSVTD